MEFPIIDLSSGSQSNAQVALLAAVQTRKRYGYDPSEALETAEQYYEWLQSKTPETSRGDES